MNTSKRGGGGDNGVNGGNGASPEIAGGTATAYSAAVTLLSIAPAWEVSREFPDISASIIGILAPILGDGLLKQRHLSMLFI